MWIDKAKAIEVIKSKGLSVCRLAEEMCIGAGAVMRLLQGRQALDYYNAKTLIEVLGFWDFAYIAAGEEVMRYAREIARAG